MLCSHQPIGAIMLKLFAIFLFLTFAAQAETITLKSDNMVSLNDQVSGESVTRAMLDIQRLNLFESNEPIYLVLNTPGGSIFAGIDFIRFAKSSRRPIHTVTIFAASMGFQIVEALPGIRYMAESGVLMSHRGAVGGVSGQFPGELNVRVEFYGKVTEELDAGVAARAGITLKEYQALIHDEYYALPGKAIKDKFADAQVAVACDNSLNGIHNLEVNTMFGPVEVIFADCPLITNPIGAKFKTSTEQNGKQDALSVYFSEHKILDGE